SGRSSQLPRRDQHGRQSARRRGDAIRQALARHARGFRRTADECGRHRQALARRIHRYRRTQPRGHPWVPRAGTSVRGQCAAAGARWCTRSDRDARAMDRGAHAAQGPRGKVPRGHGMTVAHYPLRVLQNRLGAIPRPSYCTYLVCNRCNARCGMCDSWKIPRGYELTPREVGTVFGKIGVLDVVRLTGGEPFLRDDLLEIAHQVLRASKPAVLHVTTNGSFPERVEAFCRDFRAPRRLRVMVSFDGLAEEHDKSRGRAVTFARAIETVRRLSALGPRRVVVSANHTIISKQSLE